LRSRSPDQLKNIFFAVLIAFGIKGRPIVIKSFMIVINLLIFLLAIVGLTKADRCNWELRSEQKAG